MDDLELRETISRAVGAVLFNVGNFPEKAQVYLWGQDMGALNEKITDSVMKSLGR